MSDSDFVEESKPVLPGKGRGINGSAAGDGGTPSKMMKLEKLEGDVESLADESIDGVMTDRARITPSQMYSIVKSMREFLNAGQESAGRKRFQTFTNYDSIELPDGVTSEMVRIDVRRYVKEAAMISQMTLKAAFDVLFALLAEGRSITIDPSFPKKPLSAFNLFVKNNSPGQAYSIKANSANYKSDSFTAEKELAEKEALKLQKVYLQQLSEYKGKNEELTPAHAEFVNELISTVHKHIAKAEGTDLKSPKQPKQPAPKKAKAQAQKTPFELFCMSKTDKYAELTPEKREKKLRKRFDKLPEGERDIYNNLAAAL